MAKKTKKIHRVNFISLQDGPDKTFKEVVDGTITYSDGKFDWSGINSEFAKALQTKGIMGEMGERFFPKDGMKFMKNLKIEFRSPYYSASRVMTEEV